VLVQKKPRGGLIRVLVIQNQSIGVLIRVLVVSRNVSYQMRFACTLWLLKYLFQRQSIRGLIIKKIPGAI